VLKLTRHLIVLFFVAVVINAEAQKQLVLLKKQNILLRLRPGDDFVYRLKNSKSIRRTYVNNLLSNAVVTHNDTVFFDKIDRLYFTRSTFVNRMGTRLIVLGVGLFLIDQVNVTLIQGEDFSLDNRVSSISISSVAAGLPMTLIRKKSQKLNYRYRLRTVDKNSPFYKPDPRSYTSPFIDN
jgi:hypothetical protein